MSRRLARLEHSRAVAPPLTAIVGTHALDIDDGIVLVGSDCHYRPDEPASTAHRAFVGYTEMGAASGLANWASGFAVLTFKDGLLLPPELVLVLDEEAGLVAFRGELIRVGSAVH